MKDLSHSIIVFISYLNPTYLESIMLTKQILFKETKKQKQFKNYIYKTGHFFLHLSNLLKNCIQENKM